MDRTVFHCFLVLFSFHVELKKKQAHQAALAAAAAEVGRLKIDLEATQALLQAAVQEKAAADALLRTEQGRGGGVQRRRYCGLRGISPPGDLTSVKTRFCRIARGLRHRNVRRWKNLIEIYL